MILAATTHTLEILLGGAVATSQCPVVVDYVDVVGDTITGGSKVALTNSTTPVTICDAPGASHYIKVNGVTVLNIDTAAITATVRFNNNGTTFDLVRITIPVGATLQFTDRFGWQLITKQGGVPNLRAGWVQEFRESGTWYKPAGARFFMVDVVGAGGSGGGGEGGSAGAVRIAGAGGGGGKRNRMLFLASDLPASVVITVAPSPSGGAGGVNGAGSNGTAGGNSSFGSYLVGYGGGRGGGGGINGAATTSYGGTGGGGTGVGLDGPTIQNAGGPAFLAGTNTAVSDSRGGGNGVASFLGGGGSSGAPAAGGAGPYSLNSYFSASGGAAGGGVTAANVASAGGGGAYSGQLGQLVASTNFAAGQRGINGPPNPGYMGGGACGGGSLYFATGNPVGGAGGDGGWPGGGGGGGGAASTGSGTATGGAGGKGGAGRVRVMGW